MAGKLNVTSGVRSILAIYALEMERLRVRWLSPLILGLLVPLVWQALFGHRLDPALRVRLLIGNVMLSMALLCFQEPLLNLVSDREDGQTALLSAGGATPAIRLPAYLMFALTSSVFALAVLVVGVLGLQVPAPRLEWLWAPFLLAAMTFFGFALLLSAYVSRTVVAVAASQISILLAWTFLPLCYPLEFVPSAIRPLVSVMPLAVSADAMEMAYRRGAIAPETLTATLLWAVFAVTIGYVAFSWREVRP